MLNIQLGKWEASIQDYEVLLKESPGDEHVKQALLDAQVQLKRQRGEDVNGTMNGASDSAIALY